MSYLEHPQIESPDDDLVIWRYMDLPKFLLMIEQRGLYFALLTEFEDKWEGVIGRDLTTGVQTAFRSASGNVIGLYQEFFKNLAINCWYSGKDESVAMWKLYTTSEYGVAIRSTVRDLKRALTPAEVDVYLGKVEYRDHAEAPSQVLTVHQLSPLSAVLQKRRCYKHECEVRAIAFFMPDLPTNAEPGAVFVVPYSQHGRSLSVDLPSLIHSVTTGPSFPAWAWKLLRSALSRARLDLPVVESNAFKPPDAPYIEP